MVKDKRRLPNKKRKKKIVISLTIASILAVVGSVSGTYAWYEYEARAGLKFHGTTIGDSSKLDIGLFSSVKLEDALDYGLTPDPVEENLYWSSAELTSDALLYYSEANGYAGKKLNPTTSGRYSEGDDLFLKPAPTYLGNYNASARAEKINYFHLPLAFRPAGAGIGNSSKMIFLSNIETEGTGLVNQSLRIHFKSDAGSFIYNPTVSNSGHDTVGGPLDLNLDGYYDVNYDKKEYVYGEYDDVTYRSFTSGNNDPIPEDERTTFNGSHKLGSYAVDQSFSSFAKAEYLGTSDIIPERILATEKPNERYVRLDVTIYIEGWSPYMNQLEENNYFSTKLTFELADL